MKRTLGAALGAVLLAAWLPAHAQGTVRIGLVLTLSGQFADAGNQIDNGIKTYMKQHGGGSCGGKSIEIIRKDTGGPAPDVAKRLSQELVVRDKVDMLAGYVLTPNAMAAGGGGGAGRGRRGGGGGSPGQSDGCVRGHTPPPPRRPTPPPPHPPALLLPPPPHTVARGEEVH